MTIASSYSDAREVQRLIREAIEQADYDPDSQFAIKLSLEEAIINAIKHGNKLDKDKHVHVEWSVTPEAAEIIIEDEGPGFSRNDVPDPTDDSNLQKLTGRGILLIETYMNTVEWSKGGRRVRLVRKNAGRGRGVKTA
jgi:serine/threonine-protein kinase RsbW